MPHFKALEPWGGAILNTHLTHPQSLCTWPLQDDTEDLGEANLNIEFIAWLSNIAVFEQ